MTTPSQGSGSAAEEMAESLGEPAVEEDQNKTPPSYEHGRTDTLTGSQQPQWLFESCVHKTKPGNIATLRKKYLKSLYP